MPMARYSLYVLKVPLNTKQAQQHVFPLVLDKGQIGQGLCLNADAIDWL